MKSFLRHTRLIAWREFRLLLGTPMFWVLTGVFFLAAALVYISLIIGFSDPTLREENNIKADVTIAVIHDLFYILHFFLMVQVPMLTMRAFAEERRQNSLALLQTTPASEWAIVAGKFIANAGAMLVYLGVTLVFPLMTEYLSDPQWPVIGSCYVALALASCGYVALGMFFSSLTDSQVIAAVLTYVALFVMLIFAGVADAFGIEGLLRLSEHLTLMAHVKGFLEGNVALVDAAYFVVFSFVFLFFAVRQIESLRWRS
ncbi:MAG: gliding motility-associated transport system permease protein [Candidatus Sumerlaeota bacterium]|nr:gliding motility-associated transport system permease protein [Candidatus Sumerlaeota bacterium]